LKSNVGEADFATSSDGVDRPTSSNGSNTYRLHEDRWRLRPATLALAVLLKQRKRQSQRGTSCANRLEAYV